MVSKSLNEYKAIKGLSTDIFFRKGEIDVEHFFGRYFSTNPALKLQYFLLKVFK